MQCNSNRFDIFFRLGRSSRKIFVWLLLGPYARAWGSMGLQELDIHIYIYIYIYDALDNRYGFSISVQPEVDCTTFQFFFMKCLKKTSFLRFSKVGRSVIGWRNG